MFLHDLLRDGESEAVTALFPDPGLVDPVEPFKNVFGLFRRDGSSGVGDRQHFRTARTGGQFHPDGAVLIDILRGILHEDHDDLFQPFEVADDLREFLEIGLESDVSFIGQRLRRQDHFLHDIGEVDETEVVMHVHGRIGTGQEEHLVDELGHPVRFRLGAVDPLGRLLHRFFRARFQDVEVREDDGDGRLQFMGRIGDELLLSPDGFVDGQDGTPCHEFTEEQDEDQKDEREGDVHPELEVDHLQFLGPVHEGDLGTDPFEGLFHVPDVGEHDPRFFLSGQDRFSDGRLVAVHPLPERFARDKRRQDVAVVRQDHDTGIVFEFQCLPGEFHRVRTVARALMERSRLFRHTVQELRHGIRRTVLSVRIRGNDQKSRCPDENDERQDHRIQNEPASKFCQHVMRSPPGDSRSSGPS